MSSAYDDLLNATIQHLENLRRDGARFVSIDPESLNALGTRDLKTAPPVGTASRLPEGRSLDLKAPGSSYGETTRISSKTSSPLLRHEPSAGSGNTSTAPLTSEARETAMQELRERALVCVKCPHLVASRRNVVFGVGNVNSPLMFVGEAPGMDEDIQGEPFVGKAGQLLTRIIQTMGLSRDRVYIANVLKCRPDTPGQSYGNRKPTPDEMKTCLPYLSAQIDIIRPRVIVALGATAVEGLLGIASAGITRMRGQWQDFRGTPVMPTFHPSFLLRPENASKKRLVWEDMLSAMERLEMPISEKQKGYFLTPGQG